MRTCGMPPAADPQTIRAILETDRPWAVYALGDLAPEHRIHARWHMAYGGRPALLLIYSAFHPPVLFAHGAAADLMPLLPEIADQREFYLSVRPEIAAALQAAGYQLSVEKRMWRMLLDPRQYAPMAHGAVSLHRADADALKQLYADGETRGEAPDFFDADMLWHGVFFGIREGAELIAAAGTHVVAREEGVAAIGSVYTRRDRRGQGCARRTTAAVTAELLRQGLRTIALNVRQDNVTARRVYERLGFQLYCEFREAVARSAE
jgi:ribosomal protein S18 acetylase RimI-like enzyme